MNPHLKKLIDLQNVELRLAEVRERLVLFPKRLAQVEASVAAAQTGVAKAKEAITTAHKERKRYELDAEQWKGKVHKYKDQIYEVKSNEAYKALQHEIQMAEAEMAKAEDRLLEQMVASEEYDRQLKAVEKVLKEVESAAQTERQGILVEQHAAEQELASLETERERATAGIPDELLDHYQRIARRHAGIALAPVRDETCTLCRVRVRPHVFQALRRPDSEEILHCESCTRILYYVEEPMAQAGVAPQGSSANET